ncbi:MAG TPA: hypothetical protein PLW96_07460, partial [Bacteroidales bacterium]|nr:hypothetical protein [Bacteroidales bacterium]
TPKVKLRQSSSPAKKAWAFSLCCQVSFFKLEEKNKPVLFERLNSRLSPAALLFRGKSRKLPSKQSPNKQWQGFFLM